MIQESFESRLWRWAGNCFPAYRHTGARVARISADFRDVIIRLPCNWQTKNHMGITWGGSLYAALDPVYGVMLYKLLGRRYRVIDRQAEIQFIRPGTQTLYAHFHISDQNLTSIKQTLMIKEKARIQLTVELKNRQGLVHARCEKQIQIDKPLCH